MTATTWYNTEVTCPAGTAATSPATASLAIPTYQMDLIRVRIPKGHKGFTGLQIGSLGQQIIPYTSGTWIVGDDDLLEFQIVNTMQTGAWEAIMYNTGNFPHSWWITFGVEPIEPPATPALTPIANDAITA